MKPLHARAHWTSTRAPKWGVRVWLTHLGNPNRNSPRQRRRNCRTISLQPVEISPRTSVLLPNTPMKARRPQPFPCNWETNSTPPDKPFIRNG